MEGFAEIRMNAKHPIYALISALIHGVLISVFAKQVINWVMTTELVSILTNAPNLLSKKFPMITIFVSVTAGMFLDLFNAPVLMDID